MALRLLKHARNGHGQASTDFVESRYANTGCAGLAGLADWLVLWLVGYLAGWLAARLVVWKAFTPVVPPILKTFGPPLRVDWWRWTSLLVGWLIAWPIGWLVGWLNVVVGWWA